MQAAVPTREAVPFIMHLEPELRQLSSCNRDVPG